MGRNPNITVPGQKNKPSSDVTSRDIEEERYIKERLKSGGLSESAETRLKDKLAYIEQKKKGEVWEGETSKGEIVRGYTESNVNRALLQREQEIARQEQAAEQPRQRTPMFVQDKPTIPQRGAPFSKTSSYLGRAPTPAEEVWRSKFDYFNPSTVSATGKPKSLAQQLFPSMNPYELNVKTVKKTTRGVPIIDKLSGAVSPVFIRSGEIGITMGKDVYAASKETTYGIMLPRSGLKSSVVRADWKGVKEWYSPEAKRGMYVLGGVPLVTIGGSTLVGAGILTAGFGALSYLSFRESVGLTGVAKERKLAEGTLSLIGTAAPVFQTFKGYASVGRGSVKIESLSTRLKGKPLLTRKPEGFIVKTSGTYKQVYNFGIIKVTSPFGKQYRVQTVQQVNLPTRSLGTKLFKTRISDTAMMKVYSRRAVGGVGQGKFTLVSKKFGAAKDFKYIPKTGTLVSQFKGDEKLIGKPVTGGGEFGARPARALVTRKSAVASVQNFKGYVGGRSIKFASDTRMGIKTYQSVKQRPPSQRVLYAEKIEVSLASGTRPVRRIRLSQSDTSYIPTRISLGASGRKLSTRGKPTIDSFVIARQVKSAKTKPSQVISVSFEKPRYYNKLATKGSVGFYSPMHKSAFIKHDMRYGITEIRATALHEVFGHGADSKVVSTRKHFETLKEDLVKVHNVDFSNYKGLKGYPVEFYSTELKARYLEAGFKSLNFKNPISFMRSKRVKASMGKTLIGREIRNDVGRFRIRRVSDTVSKVYFYRTSYDVKPFNQFQYGYKAWSLRQQPVTTRYKQRSSYSYRVSGSGSFSLEAYPSVTAKGYSLVQRGKSFSQRLGTKGSYGVPSDFGRSNIPTRPTELYGVTTARGFGSVKGYRVPFMSPMISVSRNRPILIPINVGEESYGIDRRESPTTYRSFRPRPFQINRGTYINVNVNTRPESKIKPAQKILPRMTPISRAITITVPPGGGGDSEVPPPPPIPPPPTIIPFGAFFFGAPTSKGEQSVWGGTTFNAKYTPTIEAALFKIRGSKVKFGNPLGLRPIT